MCRLSVFCSRVETLRSHTKSHTGDGSVYEPPSYILMAKEGFKLGVAAAYPAGIVFAVFCFGIYIF